MEIKLELKTNDNEQILLITEDGKPLLKIEIKNKKASVHDYCLKQNTWKSIYIYTPPENYTIKMKDNFENDNIDRCISGWEFANSVFDIRQGLNFIASGDTLIKLFTNLEELESQMKKDFKASHEQRIQ